MKASSIDNAFLGTPLVVGQGGGFGLYLGRGNAEFSRFKIGNIVKLLNQP